MKISRDTQLLSPEDQERLAFLRRLDAAPFEVTDWEAQFIGNFLESPRPLTSGQRTAVDGMRESYEGRIA